MRDANTVREGWFSSSGNVSPIASLSPQRSRAFPLAKVLSPSQLLEWTLSCSAGNGWKSVIRAFQKAWLLLYQSREKVHEESEPIKTQNLQNANIGKELSWDTPLKNSWQEAGLQLCFLLPQSMLHRRHKHQAICVVSCSGHASVG